MAFNFSWNDFSAGFVKQSEDLLTAALNKGIKPSIIADDITVKELYMGSQVNILVQLKKKVMLMTSAPRTRIGRAR